METLFEIFRVNHWGEFWWIMVGFLGQALFSMRFLIQWIMSERARRSVMPTAFWYFSLGGGLVLLTYAIYRRDPVFMITHERFHTGRKRVKTPSAQTYRTSSTA